MSIALDIRYLSQVQVQLPLFKWHRYGEVAACRCIICGDSQKDKTKTRLYFFLDKKKDTVVFHCKNCGAASTMQWFLKDNFPDRYQEYKLERLKETGSGSSYKSDRIKPISSTKIEPLRKEEAIAEAMEPVSKLHTIDKLADHHMAKKYLAGRMVPTKSLSRVVFTDNFHAWCEEHIGETEGFVPADQRIVFPMYNQQGEIYGAQGRVFYESDKAKRFVTAKKKDVDIPKLYGLETVNMEHPVLFVEGVIDSLFLPNCIAVCGGEVNKELLDIVPEGVLKYWIGDNEPRSKDTTNRMEKAIDLGFKVCFWKIPTKYKDVNDMVKLGGYSVKDIVTHISVNSFAGAKAKVAMTLWKK
jgi:transcription elongation factor Elf1